MKSYFPKGNSEGFDLWSKVNFALWSNIRYDFELIAELLRYNKSVKSCLYLLDTVNQSLENHPKEVFFDGTIKCLKYLVKNKYFTISNLPSFTDDEKYLIELLEKYSKRLDIMDVMSDIEEPTLRSMLLEYPNLLGEVTKGPSPSPAGYYIGRAMMKNGITDVESLIAKVDNGLTSIEVDIDKNSKEAMKCKIIYLNLFLLNRQISITPEIAEEFVKLSDNIIENEQYTKGIFNSIYVAYYGSHLWNEDNKSRLTGCEELYLDFQLLSLPENHMSTIYELFLKEDTDRVGKKYFGDNYEYEGCVVSLAVKMIIVIILFRTESFVPEGEQEDVSFFSKASLISSLNYAIRETEDKENPLQLKSWFLEYYSNELEKRVAFLKLQLEHNIGVYRMMDQYRVIYLPVFESFRFFCSAKDTEVLKEVIVLLKNQKIATDIKNDVYINFVINIQKIINIEKPTIEETFYKDTFILLITQAFEGLAKKLALQIKPYSKHYYELDDLIGDASLSVIELILSFDLSKNNSFVAYLVHSLYLKIVTRSRMNRTEKETISENALEEGFMDNIPDSKDFIDTLNDETNLRRIKKHLENLPEKQREALKKSLENNEKLTASERKNKDRGLEKIREIMKVSI